MHDRVTSCAGLEKVLSRDNAMLPLSHFRDPAVQRVTERLGRYSRPGKYPFSVEAERG
jgi:hypothetical protein